MIKKLVVLTVGLVCSTKLMADISIKHDSLEYVVAKHRIALKAIIEDNANKVDVTRTYFKASDAKSFSFVDMQCNATSCRAILPGASEDTKAIDYLFLVKNENGKVVKTQTFRVELKGDSKDIPEWQQVKFKDKVLVKTELASKPEKLEGFDDSIVLSLIESSKKYGVSAGITSPSKAGVSLAKSSAATGTTSGGTVVAGTTTTAAVSTTTIALGSVAAVGAGVAVAGGSSGGDSNKASSTPSSSEPVTSEPATSEPKVIAKEGSVCNEGSGTVEIVSIKSKCSGVTGSYSFDISTDYGTGDYTFNLNGTILNENLYTQGASSFLPLEIPASECFTLPSNANYSDGESSISCEYEWNVK